MTVSSSRDVEFLAQECRELIKHVELAAAFLNKIFEFEGIEIPYGVLIHELDKVTGSTSCRIMIFVDWLESCKFLEFVNRDDFLNATVRLSTDC